MGEIRKDSNRRRFLKETPDLQRFHCVTYPFRVVIAQLKNRVPQRSGNGSKQPT